MDRLKVRDAKDVEQVVRAAIASEQPLEIVGHGSKRMIGQPMATNALLDLSLRLKLPVLHEVIVAQTEEQARERCLGTKINRGTEAARAAVRMLQTLDAIRGLQNPAR